MHPPTPVGSKLTVTFTDLLGASVTFVPPLALNPLPVADTAEMVTFAVPTLVRVTISPVGVPTVHASEAHARRARRELG